MTYLLLFYRLILRPLLHEPVRAALTILAVTLGVAVVLAIDLAGDAATGSFRSSLETLTGDSNLEVVASGGLPDSVAGTLATLPYSIRISPRVEDVATIADTKETLPLLGLDLLSQSGSDLPGSFRIIHPPQPDTGPQSNPKALLRDLLAPDSIWVGASLKKQPGDSLRLLINDQVQTFTIRGVYPDSGGNTSTIVMDIAAAQRALHRFGRLDRILIKVPENPSLSLDEWQSRLRAVLPPGVDIRPQGAGTQENRQMLAAFRWNLRLLSYIALIVGAFLIYNTISISVVRRRPEVGVIRALGASRSAVLAAFLAEAAFFGLSGAALGLPIGRIMAVGAVKLMSATVSALYVSSRPGSIELTPASILLAFGIGIVVALVSAYSPAREASLVSPVEAMARGWREYETRTHKSRDLWLALALGIAGAAAAYAPPISGKPLFGYLSALLLVASSALAIPAVADALLSFASRRTAKLLGPEALLASQSLRSSLRRTSVLVGALSTAVAMMVSVGIMVGSFRQTVVLWMNGRLPADLYLQPAAAPAPDRHPTLSLALAGTISKLPGVSEVDRLRAYEISYDGKPAELASVDLSALRLYDRSDFFSNRPTAQILAQLRDADAVLVSEPFIYKHHLRAGDSISLSLGAARPSFRIADVFYDYGSERGSILIDRNTLLRYLPDPAPSDLAIYVAPTASPSAVRQEIMRAAAAAGNHVFIFSNHDLRSEAIRIFDRTFAITYALEAVAVIVAVMGIAGALVALVIDRRRELGLLRFLGAASGQIRKQILLEAGLLGLLSNLVGFALGLALSLVLIYVINKQSFGWSIRFHWPVAILFAAITAVYAATLLAGLYPAQVALRLNPLEAVHEE
jgi:putative ABC transport system permease protein